MLTIQTSQNTLMCQRGCGGTVVWLACCRDTEGVLFGVMQADKSTAQGACASGVPLRRRCLRLPLRWRRPGSDRFESLLEVPDDVLDRFDADGHPHHLGRDAIGTPDVLGEAYVLRRPRMDDEGLAVADVGQVVG